MSYEERVNQIIQTQQAIQSGWPFLLHELNLIIAQHVERLISQDSPEIRGRIKALRELMNLPDALEAERQGLTAELPEQDSAFSNMD